MKKFYQIIFITLISPSFFYSQNMIFKSLTVEKGLSNSDVNCLIQDKLGFIWIGTDNGLNRYDGSGFKVYRNKQNNTNSISDNSIWSLYEDRNANIWIGTKGGILNKYSPVHNKFERIKLNENINIENSITSITEDKQGFLWIGTYSQGLFRYDPSTGKLKNWKYDPKNKNGLSNNYISSLLQDEVGFIWISTYNGLNRLNPYKLSDGFNIFFTSDSDKNSISNNIVWRVSQSIIDKNILWICTANGLCKYEIDKNRFLRFLVKSKVPLQFSSSFASVVEQNVYGKNILWAATYSGLFRIDLSDNTSEQFVSDKNNSNGLLGNKIDQLMIDRSGVLWIAADKGLNYHSLKSQKFNNLFSKIINQPIYQELSNSDIKGIINGDYDQFYIASSEALFSLKVKSDYSEIKKFNELNNLNLWSIEKGLNKDLWIGTYGNGLIHFDLTTSKTRFIKIESPTFKTSAFNYIKALHLSKNGFLWIGFWGGGLASFDTRTEKYNLWINDDSNPKSLSFNDVWTLHEDKLGRLWIGTNGRGLNLFLPDNNGEFINWKFDKENKSSLINNSVVTINEIPSGNDNETILLVGTENGLSKVTIKNKDSDIFNVDLQFNNFINAEGLKDKSISGILNDDNGFLWISSQYGLMRFNPVEESLTTFGYADGLNSNIFNSDAYSKSESGLLLFGTVKGPVIFNPKEIKLSEYEPTILLTDFQVLNKSIEPGKNSPLKTFISNTKDINLNYDQNVITFHFASMDFNASEQNQFLYKLEGFDKDWINSGQHQSATYTNLDPGNYMLRVKGTNSDGFWSSKTANVNIYIAPPVWKTAWAYAIYILLIAIGLFAIRKFERSRSKLRNELRLRDLEAKKIHEIENMKSRFFANLSHEFRTPLMLIKGPAEQLLNDKNSNRLQQYQLIHRNSEKLENLIDQLLELSQLEASSIPIKAKKENIFPVLRGLFFSFSSLAKQKNIEINFTTSSEKIFVWFDGDKLDKIINNLLSNAFKFTPDGGNISLDVKTVPINNSEHLQISLKDTGIGIPKEKVDKIFDRFFQVDDSSRRSYGGSGIGLAMVQELVDLHKWQIAVDSEVGKGTEFRLRIPMNDYYLNENQKFPKSTPSESLEQKNGSLIIDQNESLVEQNQKVNNGNENTFKKKSATRATVLIVEDSEDVRIYISELLMDSYNILIAENGQRGLTSAFENLPDLIISDVMMPEMDGIEFCKRIKSDWQTSHIPVILLTAKATSENKIEGLETGADDYVTKPFSFRELALRIKNLLAQRTILREKFGKDVNFKPENITPNKADQEFLERAIGIVNKNISEPEFDSEKFAAEIFLSRSQLHRKIQSITAQSTGEFIRTIRLKKAAGLILEKEFSVTQIAFEVGFNSPSHFTKAFKQMFDCLPSEFVDRSNS